MDPRKKLWEINIKTPMAKGKKSRKQEGGKPSGLGKFGGFFHSAISLLEKKVQAHEGRAFGEWHVGGERGVMTWGISAEGGRREIVMSFRGHKGRGRQEVVPV